MEGIGFALTAGLMPIVVTVLILRFKLKKKELEMRGRDPELGPEVDALRDDLADMQESTRAQLADMQERLDFAERLLTAGRAPIATSRGVFFGMTLRLAVRASLSSRISPAAPGSGGWS